MLHPRTTAPVEVAPGTSTWRGWVRWRECSRSRKHQRENMSYSKFHMKCVVSLTLAICCATALAASAVENRYQQATILKIEQRATTRVLYYVVDTPITKEDPYYEVSLQLKDAEYEARYTPRHKDDTLPEEWTSGAKVQAR